MEVTTQRESLIDQALYDAELGPAPTIAMHPPSSLSADDIRRYMGKRKSVIGGGSLRMAKKKKPNIPVATAEQIDLLSIGAKLTDVPSIAAGRRFGGFCSDSGISSTIEEQDDEVVIIEAPTIPTEPTISWEPSMSEVGLEGQWPMVTQVSPSSDWTVDRPPSQQQGKAPATFAGSGAPMESRILSGSLRSVNIQIPAGESAL
ncbi:hypothetical protein COCNU_11G003080 [Cocos nucifera]|uniref:Uncharacterized protein n=1 Tax=Cocos nucifera TaxID=13894 RepID=A0A8K0INF0_COCNU|nr:hypothetical protein COCNU_11G003080 [Cocos nucifera]